MTPGPTTWLSWHKAGYSLPAHAGDIRRTLLLLWSVFVAFTGGAVLQGTGADLISTAVTGDGSVLSSSTWETGDSCITGRIFGSGPTSINRETETREHPSSRLMARSDGPLLIGEYASSEQKNQDTPIACVFANKTGRNAEMIIGTSGILQRGNYSRMQTLQPGESYITADGRGMIDLRHRLVGNESLSGRTFATGNLSVSEHIRMDQGDSP